MSIVAGIDFTPNSITAQDVLTRTTRPVLGIPPPRHA